MARLDFEVKKITEDKAEIRWVKGDGRKGTTSQWAKVVAQVNIPEDGRINGGCIEGEWLKVGQVVKVPCCIVIVNAEGSWRHPSNTFYFIKINRDGTFKVLYENYYNTQGERARAILEAKRLFEQFLSEQGQQPKEISVKLTVPDTAPELPESIDQQTLAVVAAALGIDLDDLIKVVAKHIADNKS